MILEGMVHFTVDGSFHNATELQSTKNFRAPHPSVPTWSRPGPDLGPDPAQPTQMVPTARKTEIPALWWSLGFNEEGDGRGVQSGNDLRVWLGTMTKLFTTVGLITRNMQS